MTFTSIVSASLGIFIVYCIIQWAHTQSDLPRVGKPGLIGYISTALRFTMNAGQVLQEGWHEFSGKPFRVPTMEGPIIVLGPEHVELLQKSNDMIFNQPIAIEQVAQLDYTMSNQLSKNPYHIMVARTDITRAVTSFIPDILEETELATRDTLDPCKDSKPVHLPAYRTLKHMVARISNRTIVGRELCRDEEYINTIVQFTERMILYAHMLRRLPRLIRPLASVILSSIFGGHKQPKKFIIPYLKQHLHDREKTDKRPVGHFAFQSYHNLTQAHSQNNITEFLISRSGEEKEKVGDLAFRVMIMNFTSIHTSTIFLTQALFELAILPQSDLECIRTEVTEALAMEGGWNKAAIARFWMIDSLLREVGRVHGLSILGMRRFTVHDGELEDGTPIPAGSVVAIYLKPVHFNPEIYPNPDVFDAFRFSRLRKVEDGDAKHGFTTVDNNYLPFSAGRHACPGRSFAAMELKIIIAHLLLNYDISLPPGLTERPRNITINASSIPDGKAELVFRRKARVGRNV